MWLKKKKIQTVLAVLALTLSLPISAQTYPEVTPSVSYTLSDGTTSEDNPYSGSAPVTGNYSLELSDDSGWTAYYQWKIYAEDDTTALVTRYDETLSYTFQTSGNFNVIYDVKFTNADGASYELSNADDPFVVEISESKLEFPNAFSPNGDGINDVYKAKDGYTSIVDFHATIFNRWGQKLYEWDDPAGGWDGKFHGKDVKQGVYFVQVSAKGADGKVYNIKRDVNLLRGYTESTGSSTTE